MADLAIHVFTCRTIDAEVWDDTPSPMWVGTWKQLINGIKARLSAGDKIRVLNLYSHGRPGMFQFGDKWFYIETHLSWLLNDLKAYFAPSAEVNIHGCESGQSFAAMRGLRAATQAVHGVTVRMSPNIQSQMLGLEGIIFESRDGKFWHSYRHAGGVGLNRVWKSVMRLF